MAETMKVWLRPHPTTALTSVVSIRVYVERRGADILFLTWIVAGKISEIAWPGTAASGFEGWERGDELWQHTCFEAFGRADNLPGYAEFNIATSARWAAYRFADYRQGMRPLEDVRFEMGRWFLRERQAKVETALTLPSEFGAETWHLGLAAVIEEKSGARSYWALHHPDPAKPDFHDPACFTATLAAPRGS